MKTLLLLLAAIASVIYVSPLYSIEREEVLTTEDNEASRTSLVVPSFITGILLQQSRSVELGMIYELGHDNMNKLRGSIGEAIAEKAFFGSPELAQSKKGKYVSIAPRYKAQGIDHIFLRIDKNGLPNDVIFAETKYNTSRLGNTRDGKQMSNPWLLSRIEFLADDYFKMSSSNAPIVRMKKVPLRTTKKIEVYISQDRPVILWQVKGDNRWYANIDETEVTDNQLKTRSKTYGRYWKGITEGTIVGRKHLLHVSPPTETGDFQITISKLDQNSNVIPNSERIVVIHKGAKESASLTTLQEIIKQENPAWSDAAVRHEAKILNRQLSYDDVLKARDAKKIAKMEIWASARKGMAWTAGFMLFQNVMPTMKGKPLSIEDYIQIAKYTGLEVLLDAGISQSSQHIALASTGKKVFGKTISSRMATRLGGSVATTATVAIALHGCITGDKTWTEGGIDATITTASLVAGHYASLGVSLGIAKITAATTVTTTVAAGGGAVGAGGASLGGLVIASAPFAAAVVAGTAVAYTGYWIYHNYQEQKLNTINNETLKHRLELFQKKFQDEG